MKKLPQLLETFLTSAKISINEEGIYPHIAIFLKDDQTSMCSMMLQPDELYLAIKKIMDKENPSQLIFGIDRNNKDGQGIDMKYHSVLTIAYYALGKWSIGAMPYASKDDVGEVQWDNAWWNKAVSTELKVFNLIEPEITDEIIGSAYQEKISVTAVRETKIGRLYEGIINKDKLDDDVKKFLDEKSLDINDRKTVISVIRALGHDFDFQSEDFGLWTLKAGKGIFPARSSKTKVYLEGVESIVEHLK